ncbi:MAG: glycosyltransferase family 4 protein, partial [Candidatus Mariimomonas ferrooxydans]
IIFCGAQIEVHKYFASADVFLLPAIYESFGNVHLEALASGLPDITTKQSGASEIIKNGTHGFAVERPENTDEIAEKLAYLMDKEVNRKMSIEARKLAESFSFEKHIKKMFELYNTVTALNKKDT